jgi:hypothetical protein
MKLKHIVLNVLRIWQQTGFNPKMLLDKKGKPLNLTNQDIAMLFITEKEITNKYTDLK